MDSIGDQRTMTPGAGAAPYALATGDSIGPYTVLSLLGRGGMGEVYLVSHKILTTRHALKLLPKERSSDPGFLRRFHAEARVMANLDHPGIVRVTGADEAEGRHYLVMDFVAADGGNTPLDVEEAMSTTPAGHLPPRVVARLVAQVCEAVYAAHASGVIHRDLKPANVLLTSRDLEVAEARVADFGLARLLGNDWLQSRVNTSLRQSLSIGEAQTIARPRDERSSTGALLGTYEYMSPEQREGLDVDERSDIFAVGVMLYRMITGKRLIGRAKAASTVIDSLADGWDDLIDRCLEETPVARPHDMAELARALHTLETAEKRLHDEQERREEQKRREAAAAAQRQREEAERLRVAEKEQPQPVTAGTQPQAKRKRLWPFVVGLVMMRILAGASTFIIVVAFNWLVLKGNSPKLAEVLIPLLCLVLLPTCLIVDLKILRPRIRKTTTLTDAIVGALVLGATIVSCIWGVMEQGR